MDNALRLMDSYELGMRNKRLKRAADLGVSGILPQVEVLYSCPNNTR